MARTAGDILASQKHANHLSVFVSRFITAQSLKGQNDDYRVHTQVGILHFDDIATFNCVL